MERCPSELWTHIFGLACTDGGITGCSVALVSRYFREAVLPVQLYSVALCGTNTITAFANLLEQREPAHRRVRHLFLSSFGGSAATSMLPVSTIRELDRALFQILSTVAPCLSTLASNMSERLISEYSVVYVPFPCLTELTIRGGFFYPAPKSSCASDYFPSLRYLNILSSHSVTALYASRAPALTHLRLSAVSYLEPVLQRSLQNFFAGPDDTDDDSEANEDLEADEYRFPSSIQKFTIHRQQVRYRMRTNPDYFSEVLRNLTFMDRDHKLEVLSDWTNVHASKTQSDWEDRITGGWGCWGERAV